MTFPFPQLPMSWSESPQESLIIPSPGQRVTQSPGLQLWIPFLFYTIERRVLSSWLRLKKKRKRELGHRTVPLAMGGAGGANLFLEDPSAPLTSWGGKFQGKLVVLSVTLAPAQSISYFSPSRENEEGLYSTNYSRNMDSGSSCATLGKLFNLSGLPAYSSVSLFN